MVSVNYLPRPIAVNLADYTPLLWGIPRLEDVVVATASFGPSIPGSIQEVQSLVHQNDGFKHKQ